MLIYHLERKKLNEITTIILHYHRTDNVEQIIKAIRKQTIPSDIWIWDNSGDFPMTDSVNLYIKSNTNMLCHPRFLLACMAKTPYIFNQDDDIELVDERLFEKFIASSKEVNDEYFIGWDGRIVDDTFIEYPTRDKNYYRDVNKKDVDLCNTGNSFFPTKLINQIPMNPFVNDYMKMTEEEFRFADDFYWSRYFKKKMIVDYFIKGVKELPQGEYSSFGNPDHQRVRSEVIRKWFRLI